MTEQIFMKRYIMNMMGKRSYQSINVMPKLHLLVSTTLRVLLNVVQVTKWFTGDAKRILINLDVLMFLEELTVHTAVTGVQIQTMVMSKRPESRTTPGIYQLHIEDLKIG